MTKEAKKVVTKAKQEAYKDRAGSLITIEASVLSTWKEYFEELLNEESEQQQRNDKPETIRKKV